MASDHPATHAPHLQLRFWGVRGSTPTPQAEFLGYGGNTACVEVRLPTGELFVFDAGSGSRNLGLATLDEFKNQPISVRVFLTHFHWDHIQGIPFFSPLLHRNNQVTFHSVQPSGELERILKAQMTSPFFPTSFDALPASKHFIELDSEGITYQNLRVYGFPLNHPQGACGYRIESEDAVVVYATDLEHGDPRLDSVLRDYAQNADVLIYDAQYTPEEYTSYCGWGHSHWLEGTRVAKDAHVEQLILFHHDPSRKDPMLSKVVQQARLQFENTLAAQEGWVTSL